ncbi:hypothetical protein JKF63_04260 [Porcisia hertigi]|uniref:Uncharacterized protein n=1 Tax=Porcisia hertigi TaxID=2761500 RepID=A0A836HZC3_9TRYP|nr:hypothetical protein JKF63_04260 [Porcisia hertigi]
MGGESSKYCNSSAHLHNREGKRNAQSDALMGPGHSSDTVRTAGFGPPHGEIPDFIPPSPVHCVASSISPRKAPDSSLTWIIDTEAAIITEWNRDMQGVVAASLSPRAVPRGRAVAAATNSSPSVKTTESGASTVVSIAPGLMSPSVFPPFSDSSSLVHPQTSAGLSPTCEYVSVTTGRSTGVTFRVPTTWSHSEPSHKGTPPTKLDTADGASSVVVSVLPVGIDEQGLGAMSTVPVGIDYYTALQKAWSRTPKQPPSLPPLASESEVNLSDIDDVLSGSSDYEELSPPVPLGLMISYFAMDWRDSGLYDAVQRREGGAVPARPDNPPGGN